jgi:hypothetical protein
MGYLGILFMLSPVVWLVEFIRLEGYESNAGTIGSLWWPVLAVVLFFVGIFMLSGFESKNLLESDCPCCGAHETREFTTIPTPCYRCIAYLRADGDRVREESLDATTTYGYSVYPDRYEPAVTRNARGRMMFKMPAFCAICGKSDASQTRDVVVSSRTSSSGPSWVGMAVVQFSSGATRRKMDLNYDGTVKQRGPRSPTDEDRMREELADVKVPVCSEHASGTAPLECVDGHLEFASYRYYKEFLALNHIDVPKS